MDITLNEIEIRILACLIEKAYTTPDYYPLTLNALTNACNQKSNRSPVLSLEETSVVRGLDELRKKGLSEKILKADSRVPKYKHLFTSKFDLSRSQTAVLCELMLRGPQTLGEIRSRADRMNSFKDLGEVEEILSGLMTSDNPMVVKLPRRAGQKENRYMHLLSGEPVILEQDRQAADEPSTIQVQAENERIKKLEDQVTLLRNEFEALKKEFTDLKSEFE
ncbi:MAG: YceH family protein [Nitrospiraceae bacterium]|nr:MAG: YceH family protein [Nitrospiraceae bacterium]